MPVQAMIDTHPGRVDLDRGVLTQAVQALSECSQACTACADACLGETHLEELRTCIRLTLDCADICDTTERVLSRHTGYDPNVTRAQLRSCIQVCTSCAEECERHATMHEHCRVCARACRDCAEACRSLLATIT